MKKIKSSVFYTTISVVVAISIGLIIYQLGIRPFTGDRNGQARDKNQTENTTENTTLSNSEAYLAQVMGDAGLSNGEIVIGMESDGQEPIDYRHDKTYDLRLPDTRGSVGSMVEQAYSIDLYDGLIPRGEIDKLLEDPYNRASFIVTEFLDLNYRLTRGEWAHMLMQLKFALDLPVLPLCADYDSSKIDVLSSHKYTSDIREAADCGWLCICDGVRADELILMSDISAFLYKWAEYQPSHVFSATTNYTKYNTAREFMKDMTKQDGDDELTNDIEEMLWGTFRASFLPLDYLNRLNLGRQLTVKDATVILITCADLHMVYNRLNEAGETCVSCSYLGVESYYNPAIVRVEEKLGKIRDAATSVDVVQRYNPGEESVIQGLLEVVP